MALYYRYGQSDRHRCRVQPFPDISAITSYLPGALFVVAVAESSRNPRARQMVAARNGPVVRWTCSELLLFSYVTQR